jgi:hypothetical protein
VAKCSSSIAGSSVRTGRNLVDTHSVKLLRPLLLAFIASLLWFIWSETQGSSNSCGNGPDYVGSAALTLFVVVVFTAIRREGRTGWLVAADVLATGFCTALGLAVAIFFASVAHCSA